MKKTILITAGPTMEPIDPVRYISNHSSGKMGYAIAKACAKKYKVILITGPTSIQPPRGCHVISVTTAREMRSEVLKHFSKADIIFKVAAVADYRVKKKASKKLKKDKNSLSLELVKNPDILKELGKKKKPHQTLVGFAAETHRGVTYAKKKLKEKNLDWIVLNEISKKNQGFGSSLNEVTLIAADGRKVHIPKTQKTKIAELILKAVTNIEPDPQFKFTFKKFRLLRLFSKKSS